MKIQHLTVTSHRSPAQLEGLTTCGKWFYARARSGRLCVNVADTLEKAIFSTEGHGISGFNIAVLGETTDSVTSEQLTKLTEAFLDLCV